MESGQGGAQESAKERGQEKKKIAFEFRGTRLVKRPLDQMSVKLLKDAEPVEDAAEETIFESAGEPIGLHVLNRLAKTNLVALRLLGGSLTFKHLERLAPSFAGSLSHLDHLDLSDNPLKALGTCMLLRCLTENELRLSVFRLGNVFMTRGHKVSKTEMGYPIYSVNKSAVVAMCKFLASETLASRLEILDLRKNGFDTQDFISLLEKCRFPSLSSLNISSNPEVGPEGVPGLIGLLAASASLRELDVSGNALKSLSEIMMVVKDRNVLKILGARSNKLDLPSCRAVALACRVSALECVDLSHNPVGSEGVKLLARLLSNPASSLVELNIGHCDVTDNGREFGGVIEFAEALAGSRRLRHLTLAGNRLTKVSWGADNRNDDFAAVKAIAKAMQENRILESLDARNCSLGDRGVRLFTTAWKETPHFVPFAQDVYEILDGFLQQKLKRRAVKFSEVGVRWVKMRLFRFLFSFLAEDRTLLT